jgi:hypothetical protein
MATNFDWKLHHNNALANPIGLEVIGGIIAHWAEYGFEHQNAYESTLSEDYVLGPAWAKIGEGLLALLNGDLGRLDGGTLDSVIRTSLQAQGWDPDTMEIDLEEIPDLESEELECDVRSQEEIDADNAYEMGL